MKTNHLIMLIVGAGLFSGCAAKVPNELAEAREAYRRTSTGPAARVAPAEVHIANKALARAERSFEDDADLYRTKDLAYVAHRKAQLAEATASIIEEQKKQEAAKGEFQSTQGAIVTQTKAELAEAERVGAETAHRLATEQAARKAAEQKAADALAALAKLAAVKEEARGMVITLSGSVLFASGKSVLLTEAKTRLDQVAEVLLTTAERNLTVEGHTDSQGNDAYNMTLSQARADAVRDYLVQRGYQADRIKAQGLGEGRPVAENGNAEGRANNRRVEIIVAPLQQANAQ